MLPEDSKFTLVHSLDLASACGFPEYTNYTLNFNGCLDYIFYDQRKLQVVDSMSMISHEMVVQQQAIPSETIPSDHLALVALLKFK